MDRGDNGFVLHESFKDLKTRRAEQEAYRRALEEQIMQKRKLQEQEREIYQGCISVKHLEVIILISSFPFNITVIKLLFQFIQVGKRKKWQQLVHLRDILPHHQRFKLLVIFNLRKLSVHQFPKTYLFHHPSHILQLMSTQLQLLKVHYHANNTNTFIFKLAIIKNNVMS